MQVHHYPRRIGDYAARAGHLSEMEDLAYRRLEDQYFMRAKPLPREVGEVARLIRFNKDVETVLVVLKEFFEDTEDGWRNSIYDAELAGMLDKHKKAKAAGKASGNARSASVQRTLNERSTDVQHTSNGRSTDVQPPTPTPAPTSEAIASDGAGAPAADGEQSPEHFLPPPAPAPIPAGDGKAALWRESLGVLRAGGCNSEDMARSFMGKLMKDHGAEVVREAVTAAITAQPVDAREYLTATCKRLKGERREPLTVPSDEAEKTAEYLRQQADRGATPPPEHLLKRRKGQIATESS